MTRDRFGLILMLSAYAVILFGYFVVPIVCIITRQKLLGLISIIAIVIISISCGIGASLLDGRKNPMRKT